MFDEEMILVLRFLDVTSINSVRSSMKELIFVCEGYNKACFKSMLNTLFIIEVKL